MPDNTVWFIDTPVFLELLDIPGRASQHEEIGRAFVARADRGDEFILPVTTIVETGNHVAQCRGDRAASSWAGVGAG